MKNFILAILILLVVSTLSICAIKPDMHKTVIVYNSEYTLIPEEVKTVEKEVIPIMEININKEQKTTKSEIKTEKPKTVTKVTPAKTTEKKQTAKKEEIKVKNTVVPKTENIVKQQTVKTETPALKTVTQTTTAPKVITQTEEEIAWNIWRSNLQNKIMQDVKLPLMPNGITFKFTFDVDKYGKVSNVQTWSTTSSYTPYAIQYIAPVIRSYQGKDILNFPIGSSRFSTTVTGGWKLSSTEKFSTPQDYNDVEKVVK